MLIPEDLTDFLFWFKAATEASWAVKKDGEDQPLLHGKWMGMDDVQIDAVEKKYQITFPPDHRLLLNILHTVDVKQQDEQEFFFNWLTDEDLIHRKLNGPYLDIAHDRIWLNDWGDRPDQEDVVRNRFDEWYRNAPRLLPLFGHRYMVGQPGKSGNPVLSVRGSDTIIYGWNLKQYLLSEFEEYMPRSLFLKIYEEGFPVFTYMDDIQDQFDSSWAESSYDDIPSWGDLIRYSEGSWKYQPRPRTG